MDNSFVRACRAESVVAEPVLEQTVPSESAAAQPAVSAALDLEASEPVDPRDLVLAFLVRNCLSLLPCRSKSTLQSPTDRTKISQYFCILQADSEDELPPMEVLESVVSEPESTVELVESIPNQEVDSKDPALLLEQFLVSKERSLKL